MSKYGIFKRAFGIKGGDEFEERQALANAADQSVQQQMVSRVEEDKAIIQAGAEETIKEIQEDLQALNRKVEDEFNDKAMKAVANFAKRVEILEQQTKARQVLNEDIANAASEAVLARTESGQAVLDKMRQTEEQARAAQAQVEAQHQASMGGLPLTEGDAIDSRAQEIDAKKMQEEQQKAMQAMQMQQQQQEMAMQQQAMQQQAAPQQQMPSGGNALPPTVPAAAGPQMGGGSSPGEEPVAVQGGQMGVAGPEKMAFAFPDERRFPVWNEKIAAQSLEAAIKDGDSKTIEKVASAIQSNFPKFRKLAEEAKMAKEEAKYVSISPKDRESCANCQAFDDKSRSCKKVNGNINAAGWCKLYYPKSKFGE